MRKWPLENLVFRNDGPHPPFPYRTLSVVINPFSSDSLLLSNGNSVPPSLHPPFNICSHIVSPNVLVTWPAWLNSVQPIPWPILLLTVSLSSEYHTGQYKKIEGSNMCRPWYHLPIWTREGGGGFRLNLRMIYYPSSINLFSW